MNAAVVEAQARLARLDDGSGRGRVEVRRDAGVVEVLLDNPTAHHALDVGMMRALGAALTQVEDPDVGLVVWRSSGPSFCSGGDLRSVSASLGTSDAGAEMAWAMRTITDAWHHGPALVVAVSEGPSVGGGAELLTAADLRWVTPGAWMSFRQVALGVTCGWGGTPRLISQVGRARAAVWLATSERVDADAGAEAGFWRVCRDPHAEIRRLMGRSPAALRALKAQIVAADSRRSGVAQDEAFASVWGGPAHREALARAGFTLPGAGPGDG